MASLQLPALMESLNLQGAVTLLRDLKEKIQLSYQAWKERNLHQLIGLDINADSIKFLQIDSSETPYKVEHLSKKPMQPGFIVKDEIKHVEEIATLLREILRETESNIKAVAMAIPRALAITKSVMIDGRGLTEDEIESRAWIEASRCFPDLVGDIYLDFVVVGSAQQDASQLELMLVACRKDHIKPYLEILNLAGLKAEIVDLNSYALERTLSLVLSPQTTETIALLNLNIDVTSLIVEQQKKLIHAHDQPYDGGHLLQQINAYLKQKGLESVAHEADLLADLEYLNIFKMNLTAHLRHIMHFFYSSRPNVSIQKIILSGDCVTIPMIAAFIQQEIGTPTEIANPFINMTFAKHIDQAIIKKEAPTFSQCVGLALSKNKVIV